MNKTVRNVGGLILAVILMIGMYGTYKFGTANVGNRAFDTMHRMVADTLGQKGAYVAKSPWSSSISPKNLSSLKYKVSKKNWRKGIAVYDADNPDWKGIYGLNKDGSYRIGDGSNRTTHKSVGYDQVKEHIHYNMNVYSGHKEHYTPYKDMHYDPKANTLVLTH